MRCSHLLKHHPLWRKKATRNSLNSFFYLHLKSVFSSTENKSGYFGYFVSFLFAFTFPTFPSHRMSRIPEFSPTPTCISEEPRPILVLNNVHETKASHPVLVAGLLVFQCTAPEPSEPDDITQPKKKKRNFPEVVKVSLVFLWQQQFHFKRRRPELIIFPVSDGCPPRTHSLNHIQLQ